MKKKLRQYLRQYWYAGVLAPLLISCGAQSSSSASKSSLILYYSQSGSTQQVAEALSKQLKAPVEGFDVTPSYDGDFEATIARCQEEQANGYTPTLNPLKNTVQAYDTIWLGYPIWFNTYASPVKSFLQTYNLAGKVVIPFCTFGSGGLQNSVADLRQAVPNATILDGFGIRQARLGKLKAELEAFLLQLGSAEGELLPKYTEQQDITAADSSIFNIACGNYPYPIGTPISVGRRVLDDRVEFLFLVESRGAQSTPDTAEVYITMDVNTDMEPEFTQVVR